MSSEAGQEGPNITHNSNIDFDENEVKEIVESIREAEYFDAAAMHPLTPASVVSTRSIIIKRCSDKAQGSYSQTTGI